MLLRTPGPPARRRLMSKSSTLRTKQGDIDDEHGLAYSGILIHDGAGIYDTKRIDDPAGAWPAVNRRSPGYSGCAA